MITGQAEMRPYAPAMRNADRSHLHERGDCDLMRRLADVMISCAILAVIAPLMILTSLIIKLETAVPCSTDTRASDEAGAAFRS